MQTITYYVPAIDQTFTVTVPTDTLILLVQAFNQDGKTQVISIVNAE